MSALRWPAMILGLIIAQTTLASPFGRWSPAPDFLLVAVIILAVYAEGDAVFLVAPVLGYIKDVFSGGIVGESFLVFFLLAYFIREEKGLLDFDSYLLMVVTAVGTLLDGVVSFFLVEMASGPTLDWWLIVRRVAGQAAVNLALAEIVRFAWKEFAAWRASRETRRRFKELADV